MRYHVLFAILLGVAASDISFDLTVSPDDGAPSYQTVLTMADNEVVEDTANAFCKSHDIMENLDELIEHLHKLRGNPTSVLKLPHLLKSPEFWIRQGKSHIGRTGECSLARVDELLLRDTSAKVKLNGYAELPSIIEGESPQRFWETSKLLTEKGWHPAFVFLFDDFWYLSCGMAPLLEKMMGTGYKRSPKLVAQKKVQATRGTAATLEDGMPDSYSVWLPLHKAQAENGGFYCIPSNADAHYGKSPEGPFTRGSNGKVKGVKFESNNVFDVDITKTRSVPIKQGQYIVHSNALFRWQGSQEKDFAHIHTFSVAFEYKKTDDESFLHMSHVPTFEERLNLLASTLSSIKDTLSEEMQQVLELLSTPTSDSDAKEDATEAAK